MEGVPRLVSKLAASGSQWVPLFCLQHHLFDLRRVVVSVERRNGDALVVSLELGENPEGCAGAIIVAHRVYLIIGHVADPRQILAYAAVFGFSFLLRNHVQIFEGRLLGQKQGVSMLGILHRLRRGLQTWRLLQEGRAYLKRLCPNDLNGFAPLLELPHLKELCLIK